MSSPTPALQRAHEHLCPRFLPFVSERFTDRERGGFHEALTPAGTPIAARDKRLLVQSRLVYVHAHALRLGVEASATPLDQGLAFLLDHYPMAGSPGAWRFAVASDGSPANETRDTYAHAFVLFALSHALRAIEGPRDGVPPALTSRAPALRGHLDETADGLERSLRAPGGGGYLEGRDPAGLPLPGPRRQNPHMHLVEAFHACWEATHEERFLARASELVALCQERFVARPGPVLGEYFTEDWRPDPEAGHRVEPGHHFEWCWILARHAQHTGDEGAARLGQELADWAWKHGWDSRSGGVRDELDRGGAVRSNRRRIWPQLECAKAQTVAVRAGRPGARDRLRAVLEHLFEHYLSADGSWCEHLDAEGRSVREELPGSTPYHITLALAECQAVGALDARRDEDAAGETSAGERDRPAHPGRTEPPRS